MARHPDLPRRYIIACNHDGHVDGMLVYLYFLLKARTRVAIFAHQKYFDKWWSGAFLRATGCIRVPYNNPRSCLDEAMGVRNRPFVIFIEGKVRLKGESVKAKTGCLRLSSMAKLPIYPLRIVRKRWGLGTFIIGERFVFDDGEDLHIASQRLLNTIYGLGNAA